MKSVRWQISAGAVLVFALLWFFDGSGVVSAVVPAALVHELGHVLALRLCRRRVTRIAVLLTGVELDYAPQIEGLRAVVCALAGPLAGILYALAACTAGGRFLRMSGSASFALSVFNLLPVLPLDGGRITAGLLSARSARCVSEISALILLAAGAWLSVRRGAFSLLGMAVWLSLCNFRSTGSGA